MKTAFLYPYILVWVSWYGYLGMGILALVWLFGGATYQGGEEAEVGMGH